MIVVDEPWVDMSEFEDDDPENAVSDADLAMLRGALAVPPTSEPSDALWEHMLSEAIAGGGTDHVSIETAAEPGTDPVGDEATDHPDLALPEPWDASAADDFPPDHPSWPEADETGEAGHPEDGP